MRTRTMLLILLLPAWFFLSAFVEVKDGTTRVPLPQKAPQVVYVTDFALIVDDSGGKDAHTSLSGRIGQRLPKLLGKEDPREKARQIVETMSAALIQDLSEKGMPAHRLACTSGKLPGKGWLIQGVFTELDEGNRLRRAAIGFGAGSTSMEIQLGISDLESPEPQAPFVVFGTEKAASLRPGAIISKNPYVLAAKFVLQKNATPKDIKATAAKIAEEILKYRDQITGSREQAK